MQRLHEHGLEQAVEIGELAIEVLVDAHRLAQEDAGHLAVFEQRLQQAVDHLVHLLDGRRCPRRDVDAAYLCLERRDELIEQLVEDGALRLEVEIEGPARDVGALDEVVDARRVVALLREDPAGHGQDGSAARLAQPLSAGDASIDLQGHVRLRHETSKF